MTGRSCRPPPSRVSRWVQPKRSQPSENVMVGEADGVSASTDFAIVWQALSGSPALRRTFDRPLSTVNEKRQCILDERLSAR